MATVETRRMTADEFWEWANLPENQDKFYELDQGEIVEMPPPGEVHGVLCAWISHLLWNFALQHGGSVFSNDTGLLVQRDPDTLRGVDVMLFSERIPLESLSTKYSVRLPELVVEVVSPSDTLGRISRRISQYIDRGVPLIWLVDSGPRIVTVYRSGKNMYTRDETEELTGEDVLPDLRLRVADLFTLPDSPPAIN